MVTQNLFDLILFSFGFSQGEFLIAQSYLNSFQVRDAGNLLTRAGFTLPGVDIDEYTVKYKNGKHASDPCFCCDS